MVKVEGDTPLAKLRAAYQEISRPVPVSFDTAILRQAASAALADRSLTRREREEVELIQAKIDMRSGEPDDEPQFLQSAKEKLETFLRTARTPEFLSEARGWLGRIHFLLGATAAGKIYLDELNRNGSNLSRETVLNSLRMTYGYDGGPQLLDDLEKYFDTPEHAAFAIQMVTNPHWDRDTRRDNRKSESVDEVQRSYLRIKRLLERHSSLLKSEAGANALALLGMRTALRMGDPPAALKIAAMIPGSATIRAEPDFDWMLASAHFLSREYAAAEQPLLRLFRSARSSKAQKAASAYALCGVYQKNRNVIQQIRFALWLRAGGAGNPWDLTYSSGVADQSVYFAVSGWDLDVLLDAEASIDELRSFLNEYPDVPDVRIVKYSLAVRLARENLYAEAAQIYQSINANRRAPRMRQLAALYEEANRTDSSAQELQEAKYRVAEYISANPDRIYFNDAIWHGFQRHALFGSSDSRLTRVERQTLMDSERKLKDGQEERWRAYLILRDVVQGAGKTDLGRKAAELAVRCLRGISDRFERQDEIRKADIELSNWLRR
jgi:hypothetical protein